MCNSRDVSKVWKTEAFDKQSNTKTLFMADLVDYCKAGIAVQRGEPTGLEGLLKACMQQAPTEALDALTRGLTLSQRRREACKHAAGILRLYNHLHVVMKVCHVCIHP